MLKPDECSNCILSSGPLPSRGFSVPEGSGKVGVTIIGESLGYEEYVDGKPFRPRAQSGSLLESTFKRIGIPRSNFKLWNLIGCQPGNNQLGGMFYEEKAVHYCRSAHFNKVVGGNNNVIFACGNLPLKYLTSASGDAKEKQSVSYLRGFVLRSDYGLVVPSYHPSFIRRGKSKYIEVFERDLLRAVKVARGEFGHSHTPGWKGPEFVPEPSLEDVMSFYQRAKDNPRLPMGCDIETPNSKDKDSGEKGEVEEDDVEGLEDEASRDKEGVQISSTCESIWAESKSSNNGKAAHANLLRYSDKGLDEPIITVQFSLREWEGISVPYRGEYIEWIHQILALPNVKLWWNGFSFDIPRLLVKGVKLGGVQIDLMWTFHHYQPDLDRNLQYVASYYGWPFPWKHYYGRRLNWYGCVDVAVLLWIKNRLIPDMKGMKHPISGVSVYDGWKRFVHDVWPELDNASERGIPISSVEREKVRDVLVSTKERLLEEIQVEVPLEVRNLNKKEVKHK